MIRLKRQSWYYIEGSLVLLLAAITCLFIPTYPTAIVLLVVALKVSSLSFIEARQANNVMQRLETFVPAARLRAPKASLSLPQRRFQGYNSRAAATTLAGEVLLLLTAFLAGFTTTTTLTCAVTLAIATTPSGLLLELFLLSHYATPKNVAATTARAVRCIISDVTGQTVLTILGVISYAIWRIPLAITGLGLLVVSLLQVWPISSLAVDKNATDPAPRKPELLLYGLGSGLLVYINFLLFFTRHHVSPAYLDTDNFLYAEASSLTLVSLFGCQFVNLLCARVHGHHTFFSEQLWANRRLNITLLGSLAICALLFYTPLVKTFFDTGPLSVTDWLSALLTSFVYLSMRLIQRHTRKHSRHAVLQLHHQIQKSS